MWEKKANFFYKKIFLDEKINLLDKSVFCCVRPKGQSVRSGNDKPSAIFKILKHHIQSHRHIQNLILWPDWCVTQINQHYEHWHYAFLE